VLRAGDGQVRAGLVLFEGEPAGRSNGTALTAATCLTGRDHRFQPEGAAFEKWHVLPCARHRSVDWDIICLRADAQHDAYRAGTSFWPSQNGAASSGPSAVIGRSDGAASPRSSAIIGRSDAPTEGRAACNHQRAGQDGPKEADC
jgi:hypothetical protein